MEWNSIILWFSMVWNNYLIQWESLEFFGLLCFGSHENREADQQHSLSLHYSDSRLAYSETVSVLCHGASWYQRLLPPEQRPIAAGTRQHHAGHQAADRTVGARLLGPYFGDSSMSCSSRGKGQFFPLLTSSQGQSGFGSARTRLALPDRKKEPANGQRAEPVRMYDGTFK